MKKHKKTINEHMVALADAQFIGYSHGKDYGLIAMVESMGLTALEWEAWKKEYGTSYLTEREVEEIEEHFNKVTNGKQ